jgi:DNA (cytosine-5)-methyltransferase 1
MTAEPQAPAKPSYRVPGMGEIRAIPWNGYTAASTFSGCGGSSLGYRMAGYRVVYANEFVPAARETYAANAAPYTIIDGRDIRAVTADSFLDMTGLAAGELDLLDGSPPCSSFSTAGKRHKGWGKESAYSDTAQRTDDLFFEFVRLVAGIQPRTFVAENVSGLVKGSAKGYFREILAALKGVGYRVTARLLDAQWLGVPQARQRLIFVGVREDLGLDPAHPAPLPYRYSVRDALPHIVAQGDNGGFGKGSMRPADVPSPTVGATPQTGNGRFPPSSVRAPHVAIGLYDGEQSVDVPAPTVLTHGRPRTRSELSVRESGAVRKLTIPELRRICGFPDDFALTGSYAQQWERLGRAVPPVMMSHIAATVRDEILARVP